MPSPQIKVISSAISDVGKKRKHNEDSYFVNDDLFLYVVADGMGGHKAGEVASKIVAETIQDRMQQPPDNNDGMEFVGVEEECAPETRRLLAGIHLANKAVHHMSSTKEMFKGMGSTVAAVMLAGSKIVVANVGDSPVYLIRNEDIELLSIPHTYMAEHAALAPEGAKPLSDKYRHMITRAVGIKPEVNPDYCEIQGLQGDILVICSDGLSDKMKEKEILTVLSKYKPAKATKALVQVANKRGGDDNITVVIIQILKHPNFIRSKKQEREAPSSKRPKPRPRENGIPIDVDTDDASHRLHIYNMTKTSGFIPTTDPYSIGQEITLTFTDPSGVSIIVDAKVKDRDPEGIHLSFEDLSGDQFELIKGS